MLNEVILMGRLTRDPEMRYTQSNLPVCSFQIAVDRDYNSKNGEKQTDFLPIVAWRNNADFVHNFFAKGQLIVVIGTLTSRRYQDKDGNSRTTYEVVADRLQFGETKKSREAGGAPQRQSAPPPPDAQQNSRSFYGGSDWEDMTADEGEVPF